MLLFVSNLKILFWVAASIVALSATSFSPSSTYIGLVGSIVLLIYLSITHKSKNFLKELLFCFLLAAVITSATLNQIEIPLIIKSIKIYIYPLIVLLLLEKLDTKKIRQRDFDFKNFRLISFIFIFAYSFLYVSSDFLKRPDFVYENNFESFFFNLLFFLLVASGRNPKIGDYLLFSLVIVASLSLSGILTSFFVLYYALHETKVLRPILRVIFSFVLVVVGLAAILTISYARGYSHDELILIDRVFFFVVAFNEFMSWDIQPMIFGRLIFGLELSGATCGRMSFYVSQIGACDSAIFHSSILRALIDFGFLGLFFWIYQLMVIGCKISGNLIGRGCFILGVCVNAVSLAGTGSEVFIWPFLLLFLSSTRAGKDCG